LTDETNRPSMRPEVVESYARYEDRVGRKYLHKMPPTRFLSYLPPGAIHVIPGEFWSEDVNDDGYAEAVIACPCHRTPRVEIGRLSECECGRFFYYVGSEVMVGNSPRRRLAPWERIVQKHREHNSETPAES
jgi:hypothetical protein